MESTYTAREAMMRIVYVGPDGTFRHNDVLLKSGDNIELPTDPAERLLKGGLFKSTTRPQAKKRKTSRRGK